MTLTLNKIKIMKLAIFLSLFFGFFLGFNNGSVFAIDTPDPSYTLSSMPSNNIYLCNNDNPALSVLSISCSDYSYINVEVTGTANVRLQLWSNSNSNFPINSSVLDTFSVKLSSTITYINISTSGTDMSGGGSVTFTFSDYALGSSAPPSGSLSITSNGTYDVTNYSQVEVDVANNVTEIIEDPISNDFQKVFFENVKKIIPAFGILLVVWFGIDILSSLIFGRGR